MICAEIELGVGADQIATEQDLLAPPRATISQTILGMAEAGVQTKTFGQVSPADLRDVALVAAT